MQSSFNPDYFILLNPAEITGLVTADNRDAFQPDLKAFLHATNNLKALRGLALESKGHEWRPPHLELNANEEITDNFANIRGYRRTIKLPARPGEPQMALSYDWFWSEFCEYLIQRTFYPRQVERLIWVFHTRSAVFNPELAWKEFIQFIGSEEFIEKNVGYYFHNKIIYKQRGPKAPTKATAWDDETIPIFSHPLKNFLVRYYETIEKQRIQYFNAEQCAKALSKLSGLNQLEKIGPPWSINASQPSRPGDHSIYSCAGCGKIFLKNERNYKRVSAFLKDADERPQSGTNKESKNKYCAVCVTQVVLCPLKLTTETLVVKLIAPEKFKISKAFKEELKKYTAHTLNINAGNYISLHITDYVDRKPLKKPLNQVWGAYHYALWKMAVTFPPELFAQRFAVEVFPGEEHFTLPRWALWFVASLARLDNVFEYKAYANRDLKTPFSQFLRLTSRKMIFQAFYTLISNAVIHQSYATGWKMNALQEIWSGLETILKEEDMPIPDYPRIAGYAGLLLPMAERVQSNGQLSDNEKKRAITKLLEEVDRPIQYAYTAARESGSSDFIFCKRPRNRYFYDKAVELLKEVGEDTEALQKEAERIVNENEGLAWARSAEAKLFVGIDQISRVVAALLNEKEKPYANEADWRAFAYQAKLALWSFFPKYLGPQDK